LNIYDSDNSVYLRSYHGNLCARIAVQSWFTYLLHLFKLCHTLFTILPYFFVLHPDLHVLSPLATDTRPLFCLDFDWHAGS